MPVRTILIVAGLVCFIIAASRRVSSPVDLTAAGLACITAALLVV